METPGDVRTKRVWRCTSKTGDIQVWDTARDAKERQRQFRFGTDAKVRITTQVNEEKDIKEGKYEGN
jgi:hypothetical protein